MDYMVSNGDTDNDNHGDDIEKVIAYILNSIVNLLLSACILYPAGI